MSGPFVYCCLTEALHYVLSAYLTKAALPAVQPMRFWNRVTLNFKMTTTWPRFRHQSLQNTHAQVPAAALNY